METGWARVPPLRASRSAPASAPALGPSLGARWVSIYFIFELHETTKVSNFLPKDSWNHPKFQKKSMKPGQKKNEWFPTKTSQKRVFLLKAFQNSSKSFPKVASSDHYPYPLPSSSPTRLKKRRICIALKYFLRSHVFIGKIDWIDLKLEQLFIRFSAKIVRGKMIFNFRTLGQLKGKEALFSEH